MSLTLKLHSDTDSKYPERVPSNILARPNHIHPVFPALGLDNDAQLAGKGGACIDFKQ